MKNKTLNIEELIPQRPPMVMIDRLVSCQGQGAKAKLLIKKDNVFIQYGTLSESGMIEAMAQTAAARTGYLLRSGQTEKNGKVPVGVIGSIKDFEYFSSPQLGEEIEIEIEVTHEFLNASVIKGMVSVNGNRACVAEMKIFLVEEKPQN